MGSNDLTSVNNIMANISWEGGAKLIYYLLNAAVQPLDEAGGDLPSVSNVHEWQYRDLMHFLKQHRKNGKQHAMKRWSL